MRFLLGSSSIVLGFVGALTACGGSAAPAPAATADAATPSNWGNPPVGAAACATTTATALSSGAAEFSAQMTGTWVACASSSPSFGGTAGFQVLPDGTYYDVDYDADGNLVRHTGFRHQGWFGASGVMNADQTYPTFSIETSDPRGTIALVWDDSKAVFVATSAPVAIPALEPSGAREGAAGCTKEEATLDEFASAADVQSAIAGAWLGCDDVPAGSGTGLPAGVAGIELGTDGTWAFLEGFGGYDGGPLSDLGNTYTVQYLPAPPFPEPSVTLELDVGDAGAFPLSVVLMLQPMKLMLTGSLETLSAQ